MMLLQIHSKPGKKVRGLAQPEVRDGSWLCQDEEGDTEWQSMKETVSGRVNTGNALNMHCIWQAQNACWSLEQHTRDTQMLHWTDLVLPELPQDLGRVPVAKPLRVNFFPYAPLG